MKRRGVERDKWKGRDDMVSNVRKEGNKDAITTSGFCNKEPEADLHVTKLNTKLGNIKSVYIG